MGCGGSKLGPKQNTFPTRLRPILQRRFEEILARRNDITINGLAKKELLEEAKTTSHRSEEEQEEIKPKIAITSNLASHYIQDCPPTPQKISVDDAYPKLCKEIHGNKCEQTVSLIKENSLDQCGDDNKDGNGKMARKRPASKESLEELEEEIVTDDYDQDESLLCPGSPSFRVYCQSSPEREEHVDEYVHGESNSDESHRNSLSQESSYSNEVSMKKISVKRRKRGMKFKIMSKGRKNIFNNMTSFYNFPCSTHNNTPILEKTTT